MKIVIVGGVAGGASAAARARRLNETAEITLLERGDYISFANCGLPYHIGGTITERSKLLIQTPEAIEKRFKIDVRTKSEAVQVDRSAGQVVVRDRATGREYRLPYDKLILSPGAEPVRPKIPGIDSVKVFTLRSIPDMDAIKARVDIVPGTKAVIIGAGYIGLEMAEALRHRKMEVSIVELENQVFGPMDPEMASMIAGQLQLQGVELLLGMSVTAIEEKSDGLTVHLSSGRTLDASLVVVSIGVQPEVELAKKAGLDVGQRGGIVVEEHMRTSDPDIYAVGDAVEVDDFIGGFAVRIPLAGPANRQGRIAADNIMGKPSVYRKTQGTAICKIFDLAAGMTGLSEKMLKRIGRVYEKIYIHPASHATYYPHASQISLKLLFDPGDGKILGAQAVGADGVDKRIDVISTAMRAGMTVRDLKDLELSYAPPYGSAKDPVNYAGFVASNVLDGDVKVCHTDDMLNLRDDQCLLDVRTAAEVEAGTIGGAIHIPVDELRNRLKELPKNKELLVFCQVGLRGYLACRILSQSGFACRNLTGGYKTYRASIPARTVPTQPESPVEMKDDAGTLGPEIQSVVGPVAAVKHIDACGLQCPGPILRLKEELDGLSAGQAVTITAQDPGFAADIAAWCHSTGHELAATASDKGRFTATIIKRQGPMCSANTSAGKNKTIIVFSNDFDRVMASFIIANGAASMGSAVTMFFTFWGLNVLRKDNPAPVHKNWIERMFAMMMPRGTGKLRLSKMNMGGLGTAMMKGVMRKKNVSSLEELLTKAKASGIRLVACSMSMDIMGIKKEELIDSVELGGVAMYLDQAEGGNVNLFI
jgi:NADPH-dependent 2,4-dienoyl-CoA reductase/sulfur reductase-like enzyme/peroxiredoxin family protein/rhodanese-related sulfurtransferase/TusA-related sulfurtransferase